MRAPTFTVAMPAYNTAETIGPAIRSVLGQTRGDFELIVVDDGSADDTAERAARFAADPRVRLIRHGENRGLAAARNTAITAGSGPYVSMLDSDDLWLPRYLEVMGDVLDEHPDAGMAYTDAWVLDHATRRILRVTAMRYQNPPHPAPADPRKFFALLLEGNFIFTSATVRRSVLDELGGYNANLPAAEDYELWLRIVAAGYRTVRAPGLLAVYRKRPGTLSANETLMFRGLHEAFRLVAEEYDVPDQLRRRARERMREAQTYLEALAGNGGARAALYRARLRASQMKRLLVMPFLWRRRMPPELLAEFPDVREA